MCNEGHFDAPLTPKGAFRQPQRTVVLEVACKCRLVCLSVYLRQRILFRSMMRSRPRPTRSTSPSLANEEMARETVSGRSPTEAAMSSSPR